MKIKWNELSKVKPSEVQRVFVSDGEDIGLAIFAQGQFVGAGFDGYEWDWFTCNPITFWADAEWIEGPKQNG